MPDVVIRRLFGAQTVKNGDGHAIESDKPIVPTRAELKSLAEALIGAYDVFWSGGFGLFEFMSAEETKARREQWEPSFRNMGGVDLVIEMLIDKAEIVGKMMSIEGTARIGLEEEFLYDTAEIIRRVIGQSMERYDAELSTQIRQRRFSGDPFADEYTYPLEPAEAVFPDPIIPRQELAAKMKRSLLLDPIMKELDEEFGRQGNPFNDVVEEASGGLITCGGCGGYYAGIDEKGFPLFVTAAHCTSRNVGDKKMIRIPSGGDVWGTIIAIEGDSTMVRGDEKIAGLTPLRLAENKSPWGLAVAPLFGEAELIRHSPGWGYADELVPDQYSYINRIRIGHSGSPLLNSFCQVTGIVSGVDQRENMEEGWASHYVSIGTLRTLYENAGMGYLLD